DIRSTITARKRMGFNAAQRIVNTGRGKAEMDGIRDAIGSMGGNADTQLARRTHEAEVAAVGARFTFGLTAILALGALAVIYDLGRRQLRQAHALAEERGRSAETEARLAAIIASATDAIVTIAEDERIVVFNAAAERMFGWPAGQALGQRLDRFIPVGDRERHHRHIRAFAETGVSTPPMGGERVLSAVRATGEELPIEARASPATVAGPTLLDAI